MNRLRRCFVTPVSTSMLVTLSLNDSNKAFASNDSLVNYLTDATLLSNDAVKQYFLTHDRALFLPKPHHSVYALGPCKVSDGVSVTGIFMQAIVLDVFSAVLEAIDPTAKLSVLDVGCATGVLTFGVKHLLDVKGKVGTTNHRGTNRQSRRH